MENVDENNKDFIFQINKLLVDMGNKFKVLIQKKGIKSKMLTGMQFANPFPWSSEKKLKIRIENCEKKATVTEAEVYAE